jgi:uroporphyrinogen decarboxylase
MCTVTTTLLTIFALSCSGSAWMSTTAFTTPQVVTRTRTPLPISASVSKEDTATTSTSAVNENMSSPVVVDPLLIRAARGDTTIDRTPVWMMRQAGRHIQEYRELCKTYPTFRQRSEITEVAVEVSLQPWRNYQTDGCILFSDILTPLPGMGCDFVIDEQKGPIMMKPITSYDDLQQVRIQTDEHVL